MNLFINYYNAGNRQSEIDYCLNKNLANDHIEKVFVFNQYKEVQHEKAVNLAVDNRPTYQDFFDRFVDGEVNILANSDIFFDDTIKHAKNLQDHTAYAITRWEYDGNSSRPFEVMHVGNCPAHYSQDVWIIKGKSKLSGVDKVVAARQNSRIYDEVRFTIGIPGCDNVIAALLKQKYVLKNPANDIKCHHYHRDQRETKYTHRVTGARSSWGMIGQGKLPITKL